MKNYLLLLLLLICFGLILWICFQKQPGTDPDIIAKLQKAEHYIKQSDSLQAFSATLLDNMRKDKAMDSIVNQAQRKEIQRLRFKVSVTRNVKEVQKAIDSIPQVAQAFETDDSLTLTFMNAVDTLEAQKARIYSEGKKLIDLKDSSLVECQDANKVLETVISDQDKVIKRNKRNGRLKSVVIGLAFVIGVLVAL